MANIFWNVDIGLVRLPNKNLSCLVLVEFSLINNFLRVEYPQQTLVLSKGSY